MVSCLVSGADVRMTILSSASPSVGTSQSTVVEALDQGGQAWTLEEAPGDIVEVGDNDRLRTALVERSRQPLRQLALTTLTTQYANDVSEKPHRHG